MKDLQSLAAAIEPIVRRAGAYILTAVPKAVDEKSNHSDLVTEFDVNTQRMLIKELTEIHPDASFKGEEEHLSQGNILQGDTFILDPIDGTTNFVVGYCRSAISVGMLRDGEQVLGIVYNPWGNEYYTAIKGQGAFCNGKPIRVRSGGLQDCVVGCGTCPYYPDLAQRTLRILSAVMDTALDVRRMGSAALDLCDVAMGRTGVFFELKLSPWDYAAAGLIVAEAGGVISDEDGNPLSMETACSVVAGTPLAYQELRDLIKTVK